MKLKLELAIKLYQTILKLNQLWAFFASTKCDCLNHLLKARTSESEFRYLLIIFISPQFQDPNVKEGYKHVKRFFPANSPTSRDKIKLFLFIIVRNLMEEEIKQENGYVFRSKNVYYEIIRR